MRTGRDLNGKFSDGERRSQCIFDENDQRAEVRQTVKNTVSTQLKLCVAIKNLQTQHLEMPQNGRGYFDRLSMVKIRGI